MYNYLCLINYFSYSTIYLCYILTQKYTTKMKKNFFLITSKASKIIKIIYSS